jgi:hypothetical protein
MMTSPERPGLLDVIAAFFADHHGPEPDLLVIGPCDRAAEAEPEADL